MSKQKVLSVGLLFSPIEVTSAFIFSGTKLDSVRGAKKITKKIAAGREGEGKNEPLRKLVISQPIKFGKKIPFGFWWLR
jgi:hypothetical protein